MCEEVEGVGRERREEGGECEGGEGRREGCMKRWRREGRVSRGGRWRK